MRRNWLSPLVLFLSFLLVGTSLATPADQFPLSLRDDLGRSVTLRQPPQRILSLAPSNTEILYALGLGDRIVGVDRFSDYPPEVREKPKVGGMIDPDYERILSLRPDLVLVTGGVQRAVVEKLESLGIPVFALHPQTVEGVLDSILTVARLGGVIRKGWEVVGALRKRIRAITLKTGKIPLSQRPTVFWIVWPEPLMTAGPRTFIHSLVTMAGGRNIAGDLVGPREYPLYSMEDLIARDPEVIIATTDAHGAIGKLSEKPGWRRLRAVRSGRVYFVDPNLVHRPGPRLVDGLEVIARLLHPDLFR
ncbi:MAG: cobalamin-binding protein [Armatimonadota bacterium]|nr:cobalamin-binding protein [Armatimonadota bacterium]MDR5702772.1 cobalamin-binding protein [Armatimonadota bacterium]